MIESKQDTPEAIPEIELESAAGPSDQVAEQDGEQASLEAEPVALEQDVREDLFVGGLVLTLLGVSLLPLADGVLGRISGAGARIPGAVFFARWGFRHVLIAISIGLLLSMLAASIIQALGVGFVGLLFAANLLMVGIAGVAIAQARRLHPEGISALGLRLRGTPKAIGAGLFAYALAMPVLVGTLYLWPGLAKMFGQTIELQEVSQGIMAQGGGALAAAIFVAVVLAPVFEEIVFRGYLQPLLVQNFHAPLGIFVTSVVFARLHSDAFLPILVLSIVLGWVHWRTHNTLACIAVHAVHNGGSLALMFLQNSAGPL